MTGTRRCSGYTSPTYARAPHDLPDDPALFYGAKAQCRVCYKAYAADWRAGRVGKRHAPGGRPRAGVTARLGGSAGQAKRPQRAVIFDGVAQLAALIGQTSYGSVAAAVAAHAVFLHPDTVRQAGTGAVFPVIRDFPNRRTLGAAPDGRPVLLDDNRCPTDAYLWAAGRVKGPDVQFNHIWTASKDPDAYTALWNLCATPALLAKTTDGTNHSDVVALLRYRSHALYGCLPAGEPAPAKPADYDNLTWAPMPPPIPNLEREFRARLAANRASPAARACREIGWVFSGWEPDPTV